MIPSTREEAIAVLRAMMTGAQKARSDIAETFGDKPAGGASAEELLAAIEPFLWGPTSVLPRLIEAVAAAERGEPIKGTDLMNLSIVASRLCPVIAVCAINAHGDIIPQIEEAVLLAPMTW